MKTYCQVLSRSACCLLGLLCAAQAQTTWYVDDDNCPGPGMGAQGDPFCSIQVGIDASSNGDEVLVSPGTYNETINFNGKAITLRSSDGPDVTIIDGTGLNDTVVRCVSGEGPDTVLEGFTVRGGRGSWGQGGGMRIEDSSPSIRRCIFRDNPLSPGGGFFNCGGGGMYIGGNSSPQITRCVFRDHFIPYGQCTALGGGIYIDAVSGKIRIAGCLFYNNSAPGDGGGVMHRSADALIVNSTFAGNEAQLGVSRGGGLSVTPVATATVANCIFWGNRNGNQMGVTTQIRGDAIVTYSDIQGGWTGAGGNNIGADPRFVDEANGDLRLLIKSPCIDAADNDAVPAGITTDLLGNPRFVDSAFTVDSGTGTPPIVDMGAYESPGRVEFIPAVSGQGLAALALALALAGALLIRRMRGRFARAGAVTTFLAAGLNSAVFGQVSIGPQKRIDVGGGTKAANETTIAGNLSRNADSFTLLWHGVRHDRT